jgi:NADPH:quinone reductase-like Zn-dependent oxidoreductase
MRALRFAEAGDPLAVLRLEQVATPEPGPGEVRVRITHRPINPSDLYCVQGIYPVQPTLPGSPGFEGAGTVDAIGPGVAGIERGQRVFSATGAPGTWAECVIAPATGVIPLPDAISDQVGAQVLANPMTAWALLTDELSLSPGDWILQTAAASALGHLVIQLAKHRGIRTINVVRRREHVRLLQRAGADAVICTADERLVERVGEITGGAGVRGAIDSVGGPGAAEVAACLGPGGTMLPIGLLSGAPLGPLDAAAMIFKGTTVRGYWLITWFQTRTPEQLQAAFGAVIELLAQGILAPPVEAEYDLANFRDAIEHAQRPGRSGKVLLTG